MSTTTVSKSFFAIVAGVGGLGGTGGAVARRFARAYPVVLLARRPESLDPLVADITNNGGRALGIPTDTSDPASVRAAFATVAAEFGQDQGWRLAAAVYNVGAGRSLRPFLDMQLEDLDASLKGNASVFVHFCFI